jgi:hypothetical protein
MDAVKVNVQGWDWNCPACGTYHCMSRSEYEPGFPLTCEECWTDFEFTEVDGF